MGAFSGVTGANMNPVLQKIQETEAPKLSALQDATYLNSKLFKRCPGFTNSAIRCISMPNLCAWWNMTTSNLCTRRAAF